jgi:5-methylcytosine-specific restriction endonuclease McrA
LLTFFVVTSTTALILRVLMKRTSLKRSTKRLMRYKTLAAIASGRLSYEEELDALRPALMARCHEWCETEMWVHSGPWRGRLEPHHKLRRSQGGQNTMENVIMVCRPCHQWIHAHPCQAYELGLLVMRGK